MAVEVSAVVTAASVEAARNCCNIVATPEAASAKMREVLSALDGSPSGNASAIGAAAMEWRPLPQVFRVRAGMDQQQRKRTKRGTWRGTPSTLDGLR